ncbi:hypothetical protein [Candidatus Mycoplasma haematohominis]|uniref:Uncharacterized protein n=1 Tax=Candidatus Mycoplasma haematohominis TaxID=1494318 RepID=A0A478FUH7_9MOLU|nr:hypothetical protein [Candidatus Mycoplasma haemohominis]GCE63700.1 hypothetical protein MHSWG343_07000 [Candidatus Mycoplasma haemohominis]
MSIQTVGAGVAGTAAIGGGGALTAYAAGAFSSKVEEQEPERSRSTYRTLSELDESMKDKEYIGDKENEIKELLKDDTSYKTPLKEKHWDNMSKKDIPRHLVTTQTATGQFGFANKQNEIAKYVFSWCKAVAEKELNSVPVNETGQENKGYKRWEAFKFACFKTKAGVVT